MSKELERVDAHWDARLYTSCPCCDEQLEIEFTEIKDWHEVIGGVLNNKSGVNLKMKCEECEEEFIVDDLIW